MREPTMETRATAERLIACAPPMRVVVRGWLRERELNHAEAEAWHLREAAKLAGSDRMCDIHAQTEHLEEARRHRETGRVRRSRPLFGSDEPV